MWIEEKNMTVFTLISSDHAMTDIDVFVKEPFAFLRFGRPSAASRDRRSAAAARQRM